VPVILTKQIQDGRLRVWRHPQRIPRHSSSLRHFLSDTKTVCVGHRLAKNGEDRQAFGNPPPSERSGDPRTRPLPRHNSAWFLDASPSAADKHSKMSLKLRWMSSQCDNLKNERSSNGNPMARPCYSTQIHLYPHEEIYTQIQRQMGVARLYREMFQLEKIPLVATEDFTW